VFSVDGGVRESDVNGSLIVVQRELEAGLRTEVGRASTISCANLPLVLGTPEWGLGCSVRVIFRLVGTFGVSE
jgi:hypothetical protein